MRGFRVLERHRRGMSLAQVRKPWETFPQKEAEPRTGAHDTGDFRVVERHRRGMSLGGGTALSPISAVPRSPTRAVFAVVERRRRDTS